MHHRSERIAQLVSEHRQKFVLALIGFRQLRRTQAQLLLCPSILRGHRSEQKSGGAGDRHENLQRNQSLLRSCAGERSGP